MPDARLILNSRYFHVAKAGEKADGKHVMTQDAAMGLVNYVGTRESVILNMPDQLSLNGEEVASLNLDPLKLKKEVADKPATHKQIDLLADLLKEFPEAKNSLEYQDFKQNPTIENTSELISHAAEFGLGFAVDLGKAKNLVEYVGKRPGVDRVGEHGLFSASPTVDIKKAQEEIANCKGNIWTHVISLRREDADVLGYDTQKPWRDLVMRKIDIIAKASNIPVSELHWYAGMHNTTHHPHIHLFIFSDNPKSGKLTVDGINKIKSEFSTVIFADERRYIYEHKTVMRDEIKQKIDEILSGLQGNISDQFSDEEWNTLSKKMLGLSAELQGRAGKQQYGWIKDLSIRQQVDEIMADLTKAPNIQKLYEFYCEDHKELQRMYRNDPKDITPLLKDKEFKSIKNKIIREAVRLANLLPENELALEESESAETPVEYQTSNANVTSAEIEEYTSPSLSDEDSLFASAPEEREEWIPPDDSELPPDFRPYSSHDTSAEPEAPADYESPAPHRGREKETFDECCQKAFDGDTNARYRLAKMYFYGQGIDRDYKQARMWYGLAAAGGHAFAKYELGKMYQYGIGIDKDLQLGKEYCLDAYWKFRFMVADKVGFDIGKYVDEGTAISDGYSGDKDSCYLMYCLGRMEYAGEGVERDYERAFQWYGLAVQAGHVHSNYCLAKMYYGGEGVIQDYDQAKYFYEQAAQGRDKYAYHALGKMYDNGIGTEQNYTNAAEYFTRASQENVPYADYRLAQMFAIGQGVEPDQELSQILYGKALKEFIEQEKQQPDAIVEFRIAEMYLRGIGVDQSIDEAVKWLTLCSEKENPRAQFELAALYQKGEFVQQDEEKAQTLYSAALAGFLKEEENTPAASREYRIAGMFAKGNGTDQDAEKAFRWYVQAAENGHAHAAYRAAQTCYTGTGAEQDYAEAVKWYEKAITGGNAYAMYALGKMYRDGIGVDGNAQIAYKYFLSAGELQHEFAQYAVGKALLAGEGVAKNIPEAVNWFEKCAEKGNHFAEYQLAVLFSECNGVPKDEIKAQKYYAAALAGFLQVESPDAQLEYRIGSMYLHGKGTEPDAAEAFQCFKQSADHDNAYAAYQAAELLHDGNAIPKDEVQAQKYYAAALAGFLKAESPDAQLEYRIGSMYLRGKGTEPDATEAFRWFKQSADHENAYAAYQAAELLHDGEAVPKDEAQAQKYYAAALAGFLKVKSPDSQLEYRIGSLYLHGKGTEPDVAEAFRWFEQSADRGNIYAAFQAAELLHDGEAVPKDEAQAQKYYAAALAGFLQMEQQSPNADMEYRIAGMFLKGKGCTIDYPAAAHWLSRCAAAGNFMAQYQLAGLLHTGKGIPQDEQKAQLLYASALRGFTESVKVNPGSNTLYLIGIMHERGLGTSRDIQTAKHFYAAAAQIGNETAADRLQQIETAENKAALSSVFGIFRAFAQGMGNNINDSTRHKYRQDKKLLQKQRELKHAHGQKEELEQSM